MISIHALRVEGDILRIKFTMAGGNFYPRPPGGGRRTTMEIKRDRQIISIHALRVEGDVLRWKLNGIGR